MRTGNASWLAAILTVLGVSLAACTSATTESTTTTSTAGGGGDVGATTTLGDSGQGEGDGQQGGVLKVGHTTDVVGFHPDLYASAQDRDVITNIYDTLVEYDLRNYDLVPSLAEDWSVSEDGLTWTFNLRQNVVFHDGSELDADDVVASIARASEPQAGRTEGLLTRIEEVVAVDDSTVEIRLSEPDRVLLSTLADVYVSPDDSSIDLAENPVGTGPFQLEEWEPNQFILLERNEGYWRDGLPYLDGIRFVINPELNVLAVQLRTGEIDLLYEAPLSEMGPLQTAGMQLIPPDRVFSIFNMYVNSRNTPWDSEAVRQAASYAIDREAISAALFGFMEVRSNPLEPLENADSPEADFFAEDALSYNQRDLEKAQQLLADAGYADGVDGGEMIICSVAGFHFTTMGQLIQSQLAEVGIDVSITPIPDGPTWASRTFQDRAGEFDLSLCGQGAKPDPYDLVNHTYAKFWTEPLGWIDENPSFYEDLDAARSIVDEEEYRATILDLQTQALEGQPNILLGGRPVFVAAQPYVKDFIAHTQAHMFFTEVWLDQ
ncbi:MAG: ABC transporter substrate-binding protein [Acidimicrobiia bacterium]